MYEGIQEVLNQIVQQGYCITDVQAKILLAAKFGWLPVLVRRNMGRNPISLKDVQALEDNLKEGDYIRDVSTWPEWIKAMEDKIACCRTKISKDIN